jgi:integrase
MPERSGVAEGHEHGRFSGLRRIRFHDIRHSFASQLVMNGVPLKAVQELLGHASAQMTERYSHLTPNVHRAAVATLGCAANGRKNGPKSGPTRENEALTEVIL